MLGGHQILWGVIDVALAPSLRWMFCCRERDAPKVALVFSSGCFATDVAGCSSHLSLGGCIVTAAMSPL